MCCENKIKCKQRPEVKRSDSKSPEKALAGNRNDASEGDEKSSDLVSDNSSHDEQKTAVPLEIDTHFQMYGKHAYEVQYGERCPLCNKRIDEYGFCACGSGGE